MQVTLHESDPPYNFVQIHEFTTHNILPNNITIHINNNSNNNNSTVVRGGGEREGEGEDHNMGMYGYFEKMVDKAVARAKSLANFKQLAQNIIPTIPPVTPPDNITISPPESTVMPPPESTIMPPPELTVMPPPDSTVMPPPDSTVMTQPESTVMTQPESGDMAQLDKTSVRDDDFVHKLKGTKLYYYQMRNSTLWV